MHVLRLFARWACALGAVLLLTAAPAAALSTDLQADHGPHYRSILDPSGAPLARAAHAAVPPILRPENGPQIDPDGAPLARAAHGAAPTILRPENGPQIDPNGAPLARASHAVAPPILRLDHGPRVDPNG